MLPSLALISVLLPGQVDVVVSRRIDVSSDRAELVARDLSRSLVVAKVENVRAPEETLAALEKLQAADPSSCGARRSCVAQLGVTLGSELIVSIDLGQVADRLAVSLEAVKPEDGSRLLNAAFTVPVQGGELEFARGLDDFAEKVAARLEKKKPPPDAPVQREVAPVEVAAVEEPSATPLGAKVAAGGAVVTGAAAITFGVLGLNAASELSSQNYDSSSGPASHLTRAEADSLATTANTRYAIAGASLAASAVLTGIALYLWNSAD